MSTLRKPGKLFRVSQEFAVRHAKSVDLDRVLELEHASFGADAYERGLFAAYLRKCGDYFLVARHGGRICGYVIACPDRDGPRTAELVSIAVTAAVRGKGAAQALMDATLRRLSRHGIVRVRLVVKVTNRRARKFYEKYGFRKVRVLRRYYEDGRDGLLMERGRVCPPCLPAPQRGRNRGDG